MNGYGADGSELSEAWCLGPRETAELEDNARYLLFHRINTCQSEVYSARSHELRCRLHVAGRKATGWVRSLLQLLLLKIEASTVLQASQSSMRELTKKGAPLWEYYEDLMRQDGLLRNSRRAQSCCDML